MWHINLQMTEMYLHVVYLHDISHSVKFTTSVNMQPLKEKGRVLWAFAGNPNALTIHGVFSWQDTG